MSLLTVTIIVFALWISAMLFYMFVSNQHSAIAQDIEQLHTLLGNENETNAK